MFLNFEILLHNGTKDLSYIYLGLYKSTDYILFIIELQHCPCFLRDQNSALHKRFKTLYNFKDISPVLL